ncbi:unnamed protein product [Lactuca saligna]|uniref:Uncharacterized protein n=1 Tax=Lactuca saligna TaxID=75948 RepID=A0AA35YVI7_LACSI|nr:unnamed protein product [Lactuca saligna]
MRKPPQIDHVDIEPPFGSDLEDISHALLPRKRKRRDPRPGVLIIDPVKNYIESPIVEQEVLPSEGPQASGSSFEAPELDISIGKSKLPESEFMDVALLQHKVFVLEQNSAKKDFIIRKQDIRISELEKENSIKDAKISKLQANLGGLTALFFGLKQRYIKSAADPTSHPTSERVVRPTLDANIDSFLSSSPTYSQERREKQIRVEQIKGNMLVMKHSDQNAPRYHHKVFIRETGKKVIDKYGDPSSIMKWGFDAEKENVGCEAEKRTN